MDSACSVPTEEADADVTVCVCVCVCVSVFTRACMHSTLTSLGQLPTESAWERQAQEHPSLHFYIQLPTQRNQGSLGKDGRRAGVGTVPGHFVHIVVPE